MQTLHSIIYGDSAKHLIVLHGLFGQSDNWGTLGKQFAQHFTVHLLDLRNHGRSFHSNEMNLELMAQDVANYIQVKEIKDVVVIGHSLGGKVAIELVGMQPKLIQKLVVADIAPKAYPPHHQAIIKALQSIDFDWVNTRKKADEVLAKYIPQLSVRQFLLKNLYWKSKEELDFRFNLAAIANHYSDLIGKTHVNGNIDCETLFLAGEKSNYILPEDEALIAQQFLHYKILTIAKAGHWLHAENPKDFYAAVLNFVLD